MVSRRALRGTEPLGHVPPPGDATCPLCGRPLPPDGSVDEHHLVPRSEGGRQKERVHRICHRKIHATLSERDLARHFSTWEALRAQPEIAAFIRWVARKPPNFYDNSRRPAHRR
jgi:5-methylcytosine-specific restriction endonuclease McrA